MHPAELAILLHRALEVRLARFQERVSADGWTQGGEPLHQARVAARRLVAVLDLVDPEAYPGHKSRRRTLKTLVDALGLGRELDVHALWLHARRERAGDPADQAVLEHLLDRLGRMRLKTRRAMAGELEPLDLEGLPRLLKVPALPEPFQVLSLQAAAWGCLEPRVEAALAALPGLLAAEDVAALHRTRVRVKKLRYALEALDEAFAPPPAALLEALKAFQAELGAHHDLALLEGWLEAEGRRLREAALPTLAGRTEALLAEVAEARRQAFARVLQSATPLGAAAAARTLRSALGLSEGAP